MSGCPRATGERREVKATAMNADKSALVVFAATTECRAFFLAQNSSQDASCQGVSNTVRFLPSTTTSLLVGLTSGKKWVQFGANFFPSVDWLLFRDMLICI